MVLCCRRHPQISSEPAKELSFACEDGSSHDPRESHKQQWSRCSVSADDLSFHPVTATAPSTVTHSETHCLGYDEAILPHKKINVTWHKTKKQFISRYTVLHHREGEAEKGSRGQRRTAAVPGNCRKQRRGTTNIKVQNLFWNLRSNRKRKIECVSSDPG